MEKQSALKLTIAQQAENDAVDAARALLSGLSQADIHRKTQQITATGRTNQDYSPQVASAVKLANTRKYGDDQAIAQRVSRPDQEVGITGKHFDELQGIVLMLEAIKIIADDLIDEDGVTIKALAEKGLFYTAIFHDSLVSAIPQ